jgi:hypothetical protein
MPDAARIVTTDADIDAAIREARLFEKYDRRVVRATYSSSTDRVMLHLNDGAVHGIPRKRMQGLSKARASEVSRIEILGTGTGLYWPALDVAHSVSGLLEGVYGSANWMKQLHLEAGEHRSGRRKEVVERFAMARGLDNSHRDKDGRIEEKRGDTLVRTLRSEYGDDFLSDWRSDAKLSTVREETGMSLSEMVRQHRRGKR